MNMNKENKSSQTTESAIAVEPVLPAVYNWKREGSFLDQIRDVWKCYYNNSEHYCARITVNTLRECRITILDEQHKSIIGIDKAKAYCESVLNGR